MIDGHAVFTRLETNQKALETWSGDFFKTSHPVAELPEVWPQQDDFGDLAIPSWFVPEVGKAGIETRIHTKLKPAIRKDKNGQDAVCGYEQAEGAMTSFNPETRIAYLQSFSLQWHRVGCGG